MKIIITGATGFIGKALCQTLMGSYEVYALSRNPQLAQVSLGSQIRVMQWDGYNLGQWTEQLEGAFCVINLAGENIASGRWTKRKKHKILQSRIQTTQAIVKAILNAKEKPKVLIQASAIGFYGSRGVIEADENTRQGEGFLAQTCVKWEQQIEPLTDTAVRCIKLRTATVLGKQGGMLKKMLKLFHFYLGGHIGSGEQFLSWISIDDFCEAVRFLIEKNNCRGAFNLTSPEPVKMKDFCRVLGDVLNRPSRIYLPVWAAKLIYAEMAEEILLASYRITPKRLQDEGFEFRNTELKETLSLILKG
ncbi:MAG: TIGR01777 family oxidoreductase [Phycisphaerae bacterium]